MKVELVVEVTLDDIGKAKASHRDGFPTTDFNER